MQTTRCLDDGCRLPEEDGIAGEAKDKIRPAPMRDHVDDLRGGEMTIPTDQEMGPWPMVPQIGEQPDEDHRIFRPGGTSAWAEVSRDQCVGGAFENEQWQITMVPIVMIIEGKLLLAMGGIIGMIEIEHNGRRRLGVAGNKVIPKAVVRR